jgi:hypothetical protein
MQYIIHPTIGRMDYQSEWEKVRKASRLYNLALERETCGIPAYDDFTLITYGQSRDIEKAAKKNPMRVRYNSRFLRSHAVQLAYNNLKTVFDAYNDNFAGLEIECINENAYNDHLTKYGDPGDSEGYTTYCEIPQLWYPSEPESYWMN